MCESCGENSSGDSQLKRKGSDAISRALVSRSYGEISQLWCDRISNIASSPALLPPPLAFQIRYGSLGSGHTQVPSPPPTLTQSRSSMEPLHSPTLGAH